MPFYAAPGVYVEEVPSGARPIGAVGTSTAAFLGATPDASAFPGVPKPSLQLVVGASSAPSLAEANEATPLALAVFGFFENGGGRCYVVNIDDGAPLAGRLASNRRASAPSRRSTRWRSSPLPVAPTRTRGTPC